MTLITHLKPEDVELGLGARTKTEALKILSDRCAVRLGCDPATVLRALADREALGSTGVGEGVALPHASIPGLSVPFVTVARLAQPVDWGAIDDMLVDLVVVALSPIDGATLSLNVVAKIARRLRSAELRARLRTAVSAGAAYAALVEPTE